MQTTPNSTEGSRALAAASVTLALLGVFLFSFSFFSIPLGALAIILALLSRGRGRLRGAALAAVVVACIDIAASGISSVWMVRTIRSNPILHLQIEQMIEQLNAYYGFEGDMKLTLPEFIFGENLLPIYGPDREGAGEENLTAETESEPVPAREETEAPGVTTFGPAGGAADDGTQDGDTPGDGGAADETPAPDSAPAVPEPSDPPYAAHLV